MAKELFATTKNGYPVWLDADTSHTATHIASEPRLREELIWIIKDLEAHGPSIYEEFDRGHPVGHSDLVQTDSTDDIIYARRIGRSVFTRFTKSRKPVETSIVTLWLVQTPDLDYEIKSGWFGTRVPSFPGDEWETSESKSFWSNHALAWGKQAIISDTETTKCPW